eukprot:Colp12_sorted_trinity150504_noHs@35326
MAGEDDTQPDVEQQQDSVFNPINAEEHVTEIESLCMNCHENGMTRMLLTMIPYFREVIVMAFECEHCGFKNSEIQSAGTIADKGCKIVLEVKSQKDLARRIVKQDSASVQIPELDFEIPAHTQKGVITTLEGVLSNVMEGLNQLQDDRRQVDPETASKIDAFIARIEDCRAGNTPFTFILDDPSGNSHVENPLAPAVDPQLTITNYLRSVAQNAALGLRTDDEAAMAEMQADEDGDLRDEVMNMQAECPNCFKQTDVRMKLIDIPYFKEVVIMAQACDHCGHKTADVKIGGSISEKGRKITLKITCSDDMSRDVLKSMDCFLEIPEIGLQAAPGTCGTKFSTVEGLLTEIKEQLEEANPFDIQGLDSSIAETREKLQKFFEEFQEVIDGKRQVTLILDDPTGNSYLQNLYAPDPDPEMTIEDYERTHEQNDALGLTDMKVENYDKPDDSPEDETKQDA